jgi:hypothetical protein
MTFLDAKRVAAITAAAFLSILATAPIAAAATTDQGANQTGAYDGTSDGSPSMNGNGDGAATGQPCAGCVGNADDKNPPGQAPDGSDANNGYECDGNSGIAKTNPAHTGCTTTDEVPVDDTPLPPAEETLTPVPAADVEGLTLDAAPTPTHTHTAAAAARTPIETQVLGLSITAPEVSPTTADGAPALAVTGVSPWLVHLALAGMALILGGLALVWTFRRMGPTVQA